jgi:hypothetical protein
MRRKRNSYVLKNETIPLDILKQEKKQIENRTIYERKKGIFSRVKTSGTVTDLIRHKKVD